MCEKVLRIGDSKKDEWETIDIEKFKVEDEKRNFNALLSESKGTTKFHEETLSGGENYTELVFKIKDKNIPIESTYKREKVFVKEKPF